MPAKAARPAARDNATSAASSIICSRQCSLPIWDDAQIAQENWGSALTATASTGSASDAGQDAGRQGSAKLKSSGGHSAAIGHATASGSGSDNNFEDQVGHQYVTDFIAACRPSKEVAEPTEKGSADVQFIDDEVTWKRPVDIFRPFRPVVHRNATPFVNPYASEEALTPMEAKVEEDACHASLSVTGAAGGGGGGSGANSSKKSNVGASRNIDSGTASMTETFHQQYPEVVTVLEDFVGDDVTRWSHCSSIEAVRRYRALPVLMQPYDGALVAGCAETPAEACGSRYSTALRHKLKQAEQLSALAEAPPFLMTALDSALLAVEQAQRYIPAGSYLWELVHPHAPGTCHPVYNPYGKYAVKLFVAGAFRKVIVDDRLPVDVLGRPLLTTTSLKELWPALIGKAIIKALGPVTGVQALVTSPELIVSALMGNWVPQYLSPRQAPVTTMATLLLYERHLKQLSTIHASLLQDASSTSLGKDTEDAHSASKKELKKVGSGSGGGSKLADRRSSAQNKSTALSAKNSSSIDSAQADPQPLFAYEYCPATVDEPIPEQSMYVCGLRAASAVKEAAYLHTAANASTSAPATPAYQLLTIHAIKPFRNTFALLLHTTPKIQLAESVFEKEKDADDVSALRRWKTHHYPQSKEAPRLQATSLSGGDYVADYLSSDPTEMVVVDNVRSPSVTSSWLTMEEFMAQMEQVVVWRVLEGTYTNVKAVTGEMVLQFSGVGRTGDSNNAAGNNAGAAAASAKQAPGPGNLKNAAPSRDDGHAAVTLASTNKMKTTLYPPDPLYSVTFSPTWVWWKLTAETAVEAVVVVSCPALTKALPKVPTYGDSVSIAVNSADVNAVSADGVVAARERRVDLHHFQWERTEPLNRVDSVAYSDGALRSTVLRFRPGTHLLRVDLHNVQAMDTIAFLSDAAMELQLSLTHDLGQDGFATVTDAGTYPVMPLHDVEYIWFKRVFTLTKPTCLTVVLSTLDAAEDVAAHRYVNTATQRATAIGAAAGATAAPVGKGSHGKGVSTANVRGGAASPSTSSAALNSIKKRSSTAASEVSKEQSHSTTAPMGILKSKAELEGVPILRFTTLVLVNLDDPTEFHLGRAGRLVHLHLEPNKKGYLIIAYTSVPASQLSDATVAQGQDLPVLDEEEGLRKVIPSPLVPAGGVSPGFASKTGPQSPYSVASTLAAPLFSAGQWKLTLRSDAELQAFDSVMHNIHDVQVEADLPRGGTPVLFRRVCTVVESTHLSLFAQLRAPLPMAYKVRITRPCAASVAAGAAAAESPFNVTGSAKYANVISTTSPLAPREASIPSVDGASNALLVFESAATEGCLFVADVFLPCVNEGTVKTAKTTGGAAGGGSGSAGGVTTYMIEAFVSQGSATAWNNHCLHRQEEVFAQVRGNAEARATKLQESEREEFQRDPEGFLQRLRKAAVQRRQQLTESAEKTFSHAQADAAAAAAGAGPDARGTRGRVNSSSGRTSCRTSNAFDTFKDYFRRHSSSVEEDAVSDAATLAVLDAVDPANLVHISVQLSFSSQRAELKEEAAPLDPVVELRQHMRETTAWLQERIGDAAAAARAGIWAPLSGGGASGQTTTASSSSGTTKSQAQRNQKEAAAAAALSMEDALHVKLARQSRLNYLRNPQHIFLPSAQAVEGGHGEGVSPTAISTTAGTSATTLSANKSKQQQHDGGVNGGYGINTPLPATSMRGNQKESTVTAAAASGFRRRTSSFASAEIAPSLSSHRDTEVVLQDGPATHFRYAAPLTPSRYRVEWLPLRSYEESTSAVGGREKGEAAGGGTTGSCGSSGAVGSKRPKGTTAAGGAAAGSTKGQAGSAAASTTNSSAVTSSTATGSAGVSTGSGAVSIVGATTLSYPLTAAECDALVCPLQAPLLDAVKASDQAVAAATIRPLKAEHRAKFRGNYQNYFEVMAAQKTTATVPSSSDGADNAVRPVVYHSLLGMREEEMTMVLKSKKSASAA